MVKGLSSFHTALFRATGGRLGDRLVANDMLLLTTIGTVTGGSHTVPLLYLQDGEALVVVASYGGRHDHPQWYKNLIADSRVSVRTKDGAFSALARAATPAERSDLWARVVSAYSGYGEYQARTEREIPLVFLDRVV